MIQRIQTVFWMIGLLALVVLFFNPLATLQQGAIETEFWINGFRDLGERSGLSSVWPLLTLALITLVLQLVTIFLYKRRLLQMRVTIYNTLLIIGLIILGLFYAMQGASGLEAEIYPGFVSVMPLVTVILNILGWRGVRRDFLMLKAVDRIR